MGGFVLILVGILTAFGTNMFKRVPNQTTTIGTVVSYKRTSFDHCDGIVEYNVGTKAYHIKEGYGKHCPLGNKEKVAYNAENPEEAFIAPTFGKYALVIAMIVLGFDVVFAEFVPGYELIFNIWGI